ncbi:MAG: threonine/serine exporter family protein [Christensenellales bacterium]
MSILIQCLACLCASASFGVLLRQPRSTLPLTSLIGLNGYLVFLLLGQSALAYFLAALAVGLLCELTARIKQRSVTLFLVSAIIPLVPGLGLYRTMMAIAVKDYPLALSTGMDTLVGFGAIALALTISTTIFANIRLPIKGEAPRD